MESVKHCIKQFFNKLKITLMVCNEFFRTGIQLNFHILYHFSEENRTKPTEKLKIFVRPKVMKKTSKVFFFLIIVFPVAHDNFSKNDNSTVVVND